MSAVADSVCAIQIKRTKCFAYYSALGLLEAAKFKYHSTLDFEVLELLFVEKLTCKENNFEFSLIGSYSNPLTVQNATEKFNT